MRASSATSSNRRSGPCPRQAARRNSNRGHGPLLQSRAWPAPTWWIVALLLLRVSGMGRPARHRRQGPPQHRGGRHGEAGQAGQRRRAGAELPRHRLRGRQRAAGDHQLSCHPAEARRRGDGSAGGVRGARRLGRGAPGARRAHRPGPRRGAARDRRDALPALQLAGDPGRCAKARKSPLPATRSGRCWGCIRRPTAASSRPSRRS